MRNNLFSQTHALYAKHVAEHIFLVYGVKLKRYSLIFGAIKPDVSTVFAKYPHYINVSLDNLCGFDVTREHVLIRDEDNVIYANINPTTVKKVNEFYNSFNL